MNDTIVLGDSISIESFHRRVAHELDFLADDERTELLSEVDEHLREVSSEGVDLIERLGTPEAYARELLVAAGLGERGAARSSRWRGFRDRLLSHRSTRAVATFLPTLRPAWWVLRGYLAVVALAVVIDGEPSVAWWNPVWPLPLLGDFDWFVSLVLICLAVLTSISLGRRSLRLSERVVVVTANVMIVALAGIALLDLGDSLNASPSSWRSDQGATSGLRQNGKAIRNIVVFDAAGLPLSNVRLFDQNGDPITVPVQVPDKLIQRPVDEFGVEVRNAYPLVILDRAGEPIPSRYNPGMTSIPALEGDQAPKSKGEASDANGAPSGR